MIFEGKQKLHYKKKGGLERFKKLKGYLPVKEATQTLIDFFLTDLRTFVQFLFGIKLHFIQVLMLTIMFKRDRSLFILPRGFGKSWTTALFCCLYAIIYPNSRIGVTSAVFRQSREIITTIEKFKKSKLAGLFAACVGKITHATDYWAVDVGSSQIIALPIGDKIRGYRFNLVIVDELLLISQEFVNTVIMPFLSTNTDPVRQQEIREKEDRLINAGLMSEEDRVQFPRGKFIGLSSASFKFQDLSKMVDNYKEIIEFGSQNEEAAKITYALTILGCDAAPKGLYQDGFIESLRQELTDAQFRREMESIFTDDSGGYYSMQKMLECSVKLGNTPTVEIVGHKDFEYVVSIDASFSDADDSDFFAISVFKLDRINNLIYIVNGYEMAGGEQKDHIMYMAYILKYFNVAMVIIDNAGWEFIKTCTNSKIFHDLNLKLDTFETDFEQDDYRQALIDGRRNYNKSEGKIVYKQYFNPDWIRKANEMLQTSFSHKRIWFCAPVPGDDLDALAQILANQIPITDLIFDKECKYEEAAPKTSYFIDHVAWVLDCIRKECSLIEVKVTPTGHQTFDLPGTLKRKKGPNRPRRDGYTSLFLGHYGAKCYLDMFAPDIKLNQNGFIPTFIG